MQCSICGGASVLSVCTKCNDEAKAQVRQIEKNLQQPIGFGWNKAIQAISGPAPKEERMDDYQLELGIAEDTAARERKDAKKRRKQLRAVYERAYFAALGGLMPLATEVDCGIPGLVCDAGMAALETVRQWPAMQAELDALIGEMGDG